MIMENWKERTLLQIGAEGVAALDKACVMVVGLGGVGAYAAEMLCRAGVGGLILADADVYSVTNKNRQLQALDSTLGRKKTEVMVERLHDINSQARICCKEFYVTEDNVAQLFDTEAITAVEGLSAGFEARPDFVVDAIDTLSPKIALIKYCLQNKIPLVSSMGAGAKYDATKVRLADIEKSYNCPLAHSLRKRLHKEGIRSGFKVVFSEELPVKEAIIEIGDGEERNKKSQTGTISYMPAVFGCVCAQAALCYLIAPTLKS